MARRPSRLPLRAALAWGSLRNARGRAGPKEIHNVLIAHNLLLGDTLMLTPLLAALRAHYPEAQLVMTCAAAFLPLYEGRPYGVRAIAFDPRDPKSLTRLQERGPYDLALVPAESRHGWLARAAGARWVRGFEGGAWYYQASLDEKYSMPNHLETLADLMGALAAHELGHFNPTDWPEPTEGSFQAPKTPYAVLHLGAGSPLRYWPPENWAAVGSALADLGLHIILTAGPGQERLAEGVDLTGQFQDLTGRLDLRDMWHLLRRAKLLLSPDTGIVHLARLTQTPSVVLYGPGQAALYGPGRFFSGTPYQAVGLSDMPCRNRTMLFEKSRPWVAICKRKPQDCAFNARCTTEISVASVLAAIHSLLEATES
jgi:ADP-heptose:LPS heptosyltransferase